MPYHNDITKLLEQALSHDLAAGAVGGAIRWYTLRESVARLFLNMGVGMTMVYYLLPLLLFSLEQYFKMDADLIDEFRLVAKPGLGVLIGLVGVNILNVFENVLLKFAGVKK